MKFAVVDIETTGLFHQGHGITEVAVVHVDGSERNLVFHSLINPERRIPSNISLLTGITAAATQGAPRFADIATELREAIGDRIFVAHNVNFDYQFLKAAFEASGIDFRLKRICTMRYARRVVKSLGSYSLTRLCSHLKIENNQAHRAGGDALATASLLSYLQSKDESEILEEMLHGRSKNAILPPSISRKTIEDIPLVPGVYYFYGRTKRPIYIGKSKNLYKRVLSHFTSSGSSGKKQIFQKLVHDIKFVQTEDEYQALLLEDAEIKKYWPKFNYAQKDRSKVFAVVTYENRKGEIRFGITTSRVNSNYLASFNSLNGARTWLYKSLIEYEINPQLGGFAAPEDLSFVSSDQEANRIGEFIKSCSQESKESFVLLSGGRTKLKGAVAVINGVYKGFATIDSKTQNNIESVKEVLRSAPDSIAARSVIRRMLEDDTVERYDLQ